MTWWTRPPSIHEVIACPAIVVVGREKHGTARVAIRPPIAATVLPGIAEAMAAPAISPQWGVTEIAHVASDAKPWMLVAPHQMQLVSRLENDYAAIAEAGCKVGIGVATGAEQVFIKPFDDLNVEPDRKLPIVMTRDILTGTVKWRGLGVINPFGPDGKLVPLRSYPKLMTYLEKHGGRSRRGTSRRKIPATGIARLTVSIPS